MTAFDFSTIFRLLNSNRFTFYARWKQIADVVEENDDDEDNNDGEINKQTNKKSTLN